MSKPIDLTNAERPQGDKPPPTPKESKDGPYWRGGAGAELARWQARATHSETALRSLVELLKEWRMSP